MEKLGRAETLHDYVCCAAGSEIGESKAGVVSSEYIEQQEGMGVD